MTPMPPEVPRTLAAYRMILGKVQVGLAHSKVQISPLEALTLASLPPERITVKGAVVKSLIIGANVWQTVNRLDSRGLITCFGRNGQAGGKRGGRVSIELTPKGIELAEAIRKALGGEDVVRMEAAE